MTSRRGFLSGLTTVLAALPFVGRGVALPEVTSPTVAPPVPFIEPNMLTPAEVSWLTQPDLAETVPNYLGTFPKPVNNVGDPAALKLHEIMRLYRDGYLDTPTMRAQVRALLPLNAGKVDDGRAISGEIETEGAASYFRWKKNPITLSEFTDVTAHSMEHTVRAIRGMWS